MRELSREVRKIERFTRLIQNSVFVVLTKGGRDLMEQMIRLTSEYLGMKYEGSHYSHIPEDLVIGRHILMDAKKFLESKAEIALWNEG